MTSVTVPPATSVSGHEAASPDVRRVPLEARVQRPARAERLRARAERVDVRVGAERLGDDPPDLAEVLLVEAADGRGLRAEPDPGGDGRRALVERDGVPVRGQPDGMEPLLGVLARPLGRAQVELQEMRVGAARQEVDPAGEQRLRERVGVRADLPLVGAELLRRGDLEARRLRRDHVLERAALQPREDGAVDRLGVLLPAEDEARARPGERLVGRRGDDVAVLDRVRVEAGGDEPGEVRHVAPEERADLVGDATEHRRVDRAGIRRPAAEHDLRPVLERERAHLLLVHDARLAGDAVVDDRVQPPGEVDLQPVRQVAAVVEPEREHGVAGLEKAEVDGHVRLRARMRLDVRVVGAEQRLRTVDRELLDLVDDLAAAVVAAAGVALRVLVRRHRADGLEDRRPGEVLGGDQLDLAPLAVELAPEQRRDVGVVLGEPAGPQALELLGRHCHGGES